jgi:uncharacterized integral membrane protein
LRQSAARQPPSGRGIDVRTVYLAIIVIFIAALIIFVVQNTESVSVSFFTLAVSTPVAVLVFLVYVLGAATGGSLFALLRRSYAGSRRPPG